MKKFKVLMILLTLFMSNEILTQNQKMVSIEMYRYDTNMPSYRLGGGVKAFEDLPFVIKIINENNEVVEKIFDKQSRKSPIETFPLLKQEIDTWLTNGFKMFSFIAMGDGGLQNRYVVILVKDE